jgi:hypothetical protein
MGKPQTPGHSRKLDGVVKPDDDGGTLAITVERGGVETSFTVYLNRLSGTDVELLRAARGPDVGIARLIEMVTEGFAFTGEGEGRLDPDAQATIEWLARRQAGETTLTYREVADATTWGDKVNLGRTEEAVEEPGDPKD